MKKLQASIISILILVSSYVSLSQVSRTTVIDQGRAHVI